MSINGKFVQAISSVNYNNGIFSLYFVGQDPHKIAQGIMPETDEALALKQVTHIPASGFIYMASTIKNRLEDPRINIEFEKLITAGLFPAFQNETDIMEGNIAPHLVEKKSPKGKKTLNKRMNL